MPSKNWYYLKSTMCFYLVDEQCKVRSHLPTVGASRRLALSADVSIACSSAGRTALVC